MSATLATSVLVLLEHFFNPDAFWAKRGYKIPRPTSDASEKVFSPSCISVAEIY